MPEISPRAGPKTKRFAKDRLFRLLYESNMDNDAVFLEEARRHIPEAWHLIEFDLDVEEPKEKVTLYLDQSVARLFRKMGKGYHGRINRILATWAQMKIAEMKALEMDYFDALAATRVERDAPEPEDLKERRTRMYAEEWAYTQGMLDALEGTPNDGEAE